MLQKVLTMIEGHTHINHDGQSGIELIDPHGGPPDPIVGWITNDGISAVVVRKLPPVSFVGRMKVDEGRTKKIEDCSIGGSGSHIGNGESKREELVRCQRQWTVLWPPEVTIGPVPLKADFWGLPKLDHPRPYSDGRSCGRNRRQDEERYIPSATARWPHPDHYGWIMAKVTEGVSAHLIL
jgi:hypothetical protein